MEFIEFIGLYGISFFLFVRYNGNYQIYVILWDYLWLQELFLEGTCRFIDYSVEESMDSCHLYFWLDRKICGFLYVQQSMDSWDFLIIWDI